MNSEVDCKQLAASALGKELTEGECQVLGVRQLADGETLVTMGEAESTLFVLVAGALDVINDASGKDAVVYKMTPGEVAGTRAFVDRTPRKATLKAIGETTVYTLEPAPFESLLDSQARVVYKVMRGLFCITHTNLMRMNVESKDLREYIQRTGKRF